MNFLQCVAGPAQDQTPQSSNHCSFIRTLDFLCISLGERDHLSLKGWVIYKALDNPMGFCSKARVDVLKKMSFSPSSTVFLTCEAASALLCRKLLKESLAKSTGLDSHILETKSWPEHLIWKYLFSSELHTHHQKSHKCSSKWTRDLQMEYFST